ncbi:WbqC family protein [Flavobacteriaceae bacterium F08102]|nr:WbqC family protein [Flavobacteriaceae bacterium F08102]
MLFYPSYFSPIIQYVAMVQAERLIMETADNYQKQTYRTRCYIYGPNGKQLLNIPVKKANHKQKTKEVIIEEAFGWKQQHLKSVAAAYRSSPFYEYYEDEFHALFENAPTNLLDFNLACQRFVFDCLQYEPIVTNTTHFEKASTEFEDFRYLVDAKAEITYNLTPYTQVFASKHGFIPNLSILDLLFNEGPNALTYLQSQSMPQGVLFTSHRPN